MQRLGVLCTRVTFIAILATFSTGCMQPYERGQAALVDNDFNAAQQFARQGLDQNRTHAESNLLMAQALSAQKRYSDALPYAKRAFGAQHLKVEAGRTLGKIYWELGRAIDAVDAWKVARNINIKSVRDDDYQRAIEAALALANSRHDIQAIIDLRTELKALVPDHPEATDELLHAASENLAGALVQKGRLEDAAKHYQDLIDAQPDPSKQAVYQLELGTILLRLARPEQAAEHLQKSADNTPNAQKDERIFEIARRAEAANAPELAIKFLQQALALIQNEEPTFRRATLRLDIARLAMQANDLPTAKSSISDYLKDINQIHGSLIEGSAYTTAANLAFENDYPELAIEILEQAMKEPQSSWPVTKLLAEAYARRGRTQDVERVLTSAIERSNNPPQTLSNTARWAVSRHNFELAKHYMERAVASSKDPTITGPLYLELANIYAELNDEAQLETTLDAYIRTNPSNIDVLLNAAALYEQKNLSRNAEKTLKNALKLDPKSSRVVDLLRETYIKSDRSNELRPLFDTWIRARGNEMHDILQAGEVFRAINDFENALHFYNRAAKAGHNQAFLRSADIYRIQQRTTDMKVALDQYVKNASNRTDALAQALQRYTNFSTEDTVRTLQELGTLEPQQWEYTRTLANIYLAQNRQQEAFALFEKYIDQTPNQNYALTNVARNFHNPDTAPWLLTFYHQRLKANPTQTVLLRFIGDAYLQQAYANQLSGNPQSTPMLMARYYYEQHLENLKPTPEALRDFASDMRKDGLWPIAAKAYQTLLDKFPPSGPTLLYYGQTLLQLGDIKPAEEHFATYFEMRGKNPTDALNIARSLIEFKRYRSAEPYLAILFDSKNQNDIQVAFSTLAEIYRDTDRAHEITPLINQFLAKSQNPSRARQLVLTLLENSGMWNESNEQLKRMRDLRGDDSVDYALGLNAFRLGDIDDAREHFERFAANSPDPEQAWISIAQFYHRHAQFDDATTAYDHAITLNPRNVDALVLRGGFKISVGDTTAAIADFKNAAASIPQPDAQAVILGKLVELLDESGHYPQALEISRDVIAKSPSDPTIFLKQIAQNDLQTNDPARLDAAITFLRDQSIDLEQLISLLSYYGHAEQAIHQLQQEIEVGDQDLAATIIFDNAHLFINTGGAERLLNTIRPLLTPPRIPDAELLANLGQVLVFYQGVELGAQYIQAAVDLGASRYIPILAHAHLALGNKSQALTWFQRALQKNNANTSTQITTPQNDLARIATRFELASESAQFIDLLHVMFTQKDYAHVAAPALVHEIINQTNTPESAFELLRKSPWMPTTTDDLSDTTATEITREVLQAVAERGFAREATTFLNELPDQVRQQRTLTELAQRLELLANTIPDFDPDAAQTPRAAALNANAHARLLMIHGHYTQAEKAARPQLKTADYLVARDTLDVLLSIARASAQDHTVDELVKNFLANAEDKQTARNDAAELLVRLGYDHVATQLRAQNARAVPTESNILTAIITAQNAGDAKSLEQLAKSYWQIAQTPIRTAREVDQQLRGQIEFDHITPLLKPALQTLNATPQSVLNTIVREFSNGNVVQAREMLLETLEDFDFDPRFTESVFTELEQQKLHVEAARFLAPKLDDAALTRISHLNLGFANLALNLDEDAQKHFDKHLQLSSDPAYAAATLALRLINQKHYQQARHYAEKARDLHIPTPEYTLPIAQLASDIAEIANPTQGQTPPNIKQTASRASASTFVYAQIVSAALHANNTELALPFIEKIITAPAHDSYVTYPLQRTLDLFQTPEKARIGTNILQQHYPRIASGNFDSTHAYTTFLSTLFDTAELHPQVEHLYQSAIRAELARTPFSDSLATYLNNLAYMYSTSNTNVDHGLDMVRRAIATSSTRSPFLLDTLGWLQYRNGEFNQSETIIRQALRSSTAPPQQHAEYYDHIATLLELRGQRQQAIWLQILRDRTR